MEVAALLSAPGFSTDIGACSGRAYRPERPRAAVCCLQALSRASRPESVLHDAARGRAYGMLRRFPVLQQACRLQAR